MTSITDDNDVAPADAMPAEAEVQAPTAGDVNTTIESAELDAEFFSPFRKVARPHPTIGPAIWIFGAMLWAYVVLGEYTTAGFLSEAIAGAILILAVAASWYVAVRRSRVATLGRIGVLVRTVFPGIVALLLAMGCALFMNFVGESSHQNQDVPMTLALMVLGMLAFFAGQKLTGPADKQVPSKIFSHLPLIGTILVSLGAVLHLIVSN